MTEIEAKIKMMDLEIDLLKTKQKFLIACLENRELFKIEELRNFYDNFNENSQKFSTLISNYKKYLMV